MASRNTKPAGEAAAEPAPEEKKAEEKQPPAPQAPNLDPAGLTEITQETDEGDAESASAPQTPAPVGDFVVLNGPSSFGPVLIGGQSVRCRKNVLYQVSDLAERVAILGTGRFRSATQKDLARSKQSAAGPGGPVTRELLPPGAVKGGQK